MKNEDHKCNVGCRDLGILFSNKIMSECNEKLRQLPILSDIVLDRDAVVVGLKNKTLKSVDCFGKDRPVWKYFGKIVNQEARCVSGYVACLCCCHSGQGVYSWKKGNGLGSYIAKTYSDL